MKYLNVTYLLRTMVVSLMMITGMQAMAQTEDLEVPADSIDIMMAHIDSLVRNDSLVIPQEKPIQSVMLDTAIIDKPKRDWNVWKPDPQRALWLALVLPGAGQIYNRKYWKLPIIYGGFIGCVYALTWNNMMYKDYSQAYLDIMDSDPNTASYNKFLHLGMQINSSNEERYKQIFKSRKDKYRRWRDMSFFVMIGVYALSVIDAYVDAELSAFDISKDLSLKVEPAVIPNYSGGNPLQAQSLGVNCKLNF